MSLTRPRKRTNQQHVGALLFLLFLFVCPQRILANASVFVNTGVPSCGVSGYCTAASMFGVLAGPSDTLQFKGGTFLNDIGLGTGATITTTGTDNIGDASHGDVIDFSSTFTPSVTPCAGNTNCTHPTGTTFSSGTKVWGGTKLNPTLVSNAYTQFLDVSAYWNSQVTSALPSQSLSGNWNIQNTGTGTHVYNASAGFNPSADVTIGCGAAGNATAVNLACNKSDLIVIIVPNTQVASILHNINFAAGSGLTDDQVLFLVNSTASNALAINASGNANITVHGDFFVDNGGGYTIGSGASSLSTIDGRVFAGGGTGFPTLVWNHSIALSDEETVPEPATWALMAGGLAAGIWLHRRRRTARA